MTVSGTVISKSATLGPSQPKLASTSNSKVKTVAVATLGCKVNSYESELIVEKLVQQGYQRVTNKQAADLYVINSCTVTAEADRQSRQVARKLKRLNPDAKVVMTGCYAQNNPEICADLDAVDWVVGNAAKLHIPVLVKEHDSASSASQSVSANISVQDKIIRPEFGELMSVPSDLLTGYEQQSRAFIQIQQGCNQGCTFCIIHTARGPSLSFSPQTVLAQYKQVAQNGYKEVVICGVDLGAYGEDFDEPSTLTNLLQSMLALDLDCRIRISSIDPIHITDELITLFANDARLCSHLHLSMQSANTLILKRMKRRANREHIYDVVQRLRAARPDLVLSADVLVGFPTEEIEHFADTLSAIDDLQIAYPHVFPYSRREGTPAAKIPNQVAADEKKRRAALVREAGAAVWQRQAEGLINSLATAVVETEHKDGYLLARRSDYFAVQIPLHSAAVGQLANVQINALQDKSLIGEVSLQGL